jgi:hypothetical protein
MKSKSRKRRGLVATEIADERGEWSFIVVDRRLETAVITADDRRKVCGAANVKIINPYALLVDEGPELESDNWNPLNDLDPEDVREMSTDEENKSPPAACAAAGASGGACRRRRP